MLKCYIIYNALILVPLEIDEKASTAKNWKRFKELEPY